MQLMKQALYLQATTAGFFLSFSFLNSLVRAANRLAFTFGDDFSMCKNPKMLILIIES